MYVYIYIYKYRYTYYLIDHQTQQEAEIITEQKAQLEKA